MRIFSDFNEIKSAVGTEIGASDWTCFLARSFR